MAAAVAAPMAGRLLDALGGPRATLLQAMTIQMAGLLLMARTLAGHGLASVIAATVIWAAGKVIADVAGTITATSGLGQDRTGLAAGLLSTAQQLGAAGGLGVVAPVVAARTDALGGTATGSQAPVQALQWGLLAGVVLVALWPSSSCWSGCADTLKARKPRLDRHSSLVNVEMVWRAIAASAPTDR